MTPKPEKTGKRLRSGYTTGACAAAAAKAAWLLMQRGAPPAGVEIPFPDGGRHRFALAESARLCAADGRARFMAGIRKDAGDDPDVTNGAVIRATVWRAATPPAGGVPAGGGITLLAGEGVGRVTKAGLAVPVGEPAINPVPREMIAAALAEAGVEEHIAVEISVPGGERLAEKTLNRRLGIVGGLSILGTTGIVRPVSAAAWTATITASMDVARAAGISEVVLSTGRTSEAGAFSVLDLPEEAGVMMGDYLEFSLKEAAAHGFRKIHLAGMWAKVLKAALGIPQTHVRNGALEVADAVGLLAGLGMPEEMAGEMRGCNTAREILTRLDAAGRGDLVTGVCRAARAYARRVSGLPVTLYLVESGGRVREVVP